MDDPQPEHATHASSDFMFQLAELEKKYDARFRVVFEAIRDLRKPPPGPRKRIGFTPER